MFTETINLGADLSIATMIEGEGRPALVLHGGGGPATVMAISKHLAMSMQVLTPTHPGWNDTPRPPTFNRVTGLAAAYLQLLEAKGMRDVLVLGSSLGGWIGAEMALLDRAGIVGGLVLINAAGIQVEGEPMMDFFALDARGVADNAFHDGDRFYVDPTSISPEQIAVRRENMATLRAFAGEPYMHNPALRQQLGDLRTPALVIWGESDRIMTPGYGAAYAAAIPSAQFEIVSRAGHLPHIEQPAATLSLIDKFVASLVGAECLLTTEST